MRVFRATYRKGNIEITENFHCSGYQILEEIEKRFGNVSINDVEVEEITSEFYKTFEKVGDGWCWLNVYLYQMFESMN